MSLIVNKEGAPQTRSSGPVFALGRRRLDLWIAVFLCLAALSLYLRTLSPTVLDGDSGEWQYMTFVLGVPHSPGYPLFIFLGKLFTLLPIRDVAYRINLFSAVFAALTAPVIYYTVKRLSSQRLPAILATLVFVVMPSVWRSAIQAEVYSLHLFLGVLSLFLALRWLQEGDCRDFYWLSFVYGLALTNHPIVRFMAPALLIAVWLNRAHITRRVLLQGALFAAIPLLLYAYLPIRADQLIAQQDPENLKLYTRPDAILKGVVTAYYNHTPEGIFNLISGFDNRQKLEIKSSLEQVNRVELALRLLFEQFGPMGIILAAAGAVKSFLTDRKSFVLLFSTAVCIGLVALILRGVSTVFYFSLTYAVLVIWIGIEMEAILQLGQKVLHHTRSQAVGLIASPTAIAFVLLLLPVSTLLMNFWRIDASQNYGPRDYAQSVLNQDLPPKAVVIAPWEVSQPIRYFQFVENQRPDLLVVNVSPVGITERQFKQMLSTAYELKRPFYLVQFTPEFSTDPGPRSVQAVPLPMLEEPRPRHPLVNTWLVPEVQVLGYDLYPDPPQPGKPARVQIYYRAVDRMYPLYSSFLEVEDVLGRSWGEYHSFPASVNFPTYRWYELGEYYREIVDVHLPAEAPSGLYRLNLAWYVYDLQTRRPDYGQEKGTSLGMIRVGNFTASNGDIKHPQDLAVGEAIKFLGWSSAPSFEQGVALKSGDTLVVDLFWSAARPIAESYTVFVHLTDANGQVVADADSPPSSGLYGTDRWQSGETVRDRHTLRIPSVATGDYAIQVGMYLASTGSRLPIGPSDSITLTKVHVR